jgi:hypothetical protein
VPFSACGQKLSGRTAVRACLASAAAALIMATAAHADFKDVVAERFSSNPEHIIVNLPPRPGTWPGAIFTFNMRFATKGGDPNDPALHRGQKTRIDISDGLRLDASSKDSIWSSFRLSPEAADTVDAVMSFPDAQAVEMSPADLLRHVETAPAAATVAKRGQIPLIVIRAYVGTPLLTISRKAGTAADAWARVKAELEAGAQVPSSIQDSVSYTAGDPLVFAFEVAQISYDPSELSKGNTKVVLAPLPGSLFAVREQESDRALAAAEAAISAITGLSAHEIQQKWLFVDPARPSLPVAQAPEQLPFPPAAPASVNAPPAAIPAPVPRPAAAQAVVGGRPSLRIQKGQSLRPKSARVKSNKHRRTVR